MYSYIRYSITYIYIYIPYSQKYWQGHKFGGLAVGKATVKLKSASISYTQIIIYIYVTVHKKTNHIALTIIFLVKVTIANYNL